jgi:hypothetical protein
MKAIHHEDTECTEKKPPAQLISSSRLRAFAVKKGFTAKARRREEE